MTPENSPRPSLAPVSWLTLVIWCAAGIVAGLVLRLVFDRHGGVPAPLWVWLVILVPLLITAAAAVSARRRVQVQRLRIDPVNAMRMLQLARTSMVAGASLAGIYGVLAVTDISRWAAPAGRTRVIHAAAAAILAAGWMVAGRVLESQLRIPPKNDEAQNSSNSENDRNSG